MDKSIFSAHWYRVAELKARLRGHARIHRYHFRGKLWYMLQDRTSGRYHRFTPATYLVISLFDGERTVQEIWDMACEQLGDDVLTQDEMLQLLAQLHACNVLYGDVPPDLDEMSDKASKQQRRKLVMSLINPLAIRVPVLDPEEFLNATFPIVRPIFSWLGAFSFIVIVSYAIMLAGVHWSELTENIADRVFAAESQLLLLLTYPFVKILHELGHGYAIKKWGGEVHEIGFMFLVFMPVPYIDASDVSSFHEKWQRALVSAAGILVELLLAAIAMLIWVNAEEGLVRAFAFNVMLIGGVSTVLFNGNPLLRFDGYYVLSDLIEIPNLGQRANQYLGYLIQRYLFSVEGLDSPVTTSGEAWWLFWYSSLSFIYRGFIVVSIVSFVATKFFFIGIMMAMWAVVLMVIVPLIKQLMFLFVSPVLYRQRGRAISVSVVIIGAILGGLLLIPVPYATVTEGVVWTSDDAVVYVGTEGFVSELLVQPNSKVGVGDVLLRLEDPLLAAEKKILEERRNELQLRYATEYIDDPVEAKIVSEQLRHAQADLELTQNRIENLYVKSQANGRFVLSRASDLLGKFLRKGEVIGYIIQSRNQVIRVVVNEDQADLVRTRVEKVEIKLAEDIGKSLPASIMREVPALSNTLPSIALSTVGGGDIMMSPSANNEMLALTNLLHLELRLDSPLESVNLGERVYVRFSHGMEPLAARIYRTVRQVFLRQFNV